MKWHRQLAILGTASLLLGLTGCSGSSANTDPISYTGTALDTVISIKIYDSQDNDLLTKCQKICDDYEARLSRTREGSEIWQINHAEGAYTEVSDDTLKLIQEGLHYSELSDGAFDITIGTVTELWDFKSDDPQVPDASVLAEAVTHVDYHNVEIDGNLVRLSDPESKIDLGAIAKGFIADKLKEYLKSEGVEHALIDLGGNVLAIGDKPDGSSFLIGIQKPFDDRGELIASIELNNQAAVTSGTYQRCFEKDGDFYHHILQPSDGMPCNNGLNSVTILTDSSLTADALSTTTFLLGPDKGMDLINSLDGVEAVFIDTDNNLTYSDNFPK